MKFYIWRIYTSGGFYINYGCFNKSVKTSREYLKKVYNDSGGKYFNDKPDQIIKPPFAFSFDSRTNIYKLP